MKRIKEDLFARTCLILGFSTTGLVSFDIPLRREALLMEDVKAKLPKSQEFVFSRRAPNSSRLVVSVCNMQRLLIGRTNNKGL